MRFLSIDLETTGTNDEKHQIIEVGAVIEDTNAELLVDVEHLPKFHCFVESADGQYHGEAFPINLNQRIFKALARIEGANTQNIPIYKDYEVAKKFQEFLLANGFTKNDKSEQVTFHAAGKCFATFDKKFLERLPSWQKYLQITRRVLDPAILYVDWIEDNGLPDLKTCKQRANIKGEVTHVALEDAYDVILLLRESYNKKISEIF